MQHAVKKSFSTAVIYKGAQRITGTPVIARFLHAAARGITPATKYEGRGTMDGKLFCSAGIYQYLPTAGGGGIATVKIKVEGQLVGPWFRHSSQVR